MMLAANNPIMMRAYHPQLAAVQTKAPRKSRFTPTIGFTGWQASTSWLLKGYLPDNSFGVVYGPSGSFKSFAVLDWACCIALGEPWLGCRVKAGRVVYVAAEGASGLRKRIKGWCDAYNDGDNIDRLQVVGCPVDLRDHLQVGEFIETIKGADGDPVRLVVVDTLARCFGDGDENSASDMNIAIQACDRIKFETGATVLVVHHSGKDDAKGARGSSALRAACDFEIAVKRGGGLGCELATTKMKDSEQIGGVVIPLEVRDLGILDEDGEAVTTLVRSRHVSSLKACKAKPDTQKSELQDLILSTLSDCDNGMPWSDLRDTIAHCLGVDRNDPKQKTAMTRAMNELLQSKAITGSVSGKENIRLA